MVPSQSPIIFRTVSFDSETLLRDSRVMISMTRNEAANIMPHILVQRSPVKEASLMAAGRGPITKKSHLGQVWFWGSFSSSSPLITVADLSKTTRWLAFKGLVLKNREMVTRRTRAERASARQMMGELER